MNHPFIVAIDGPAASGKGTLARNLAKALDYDFLPTGNIYRALAKRVINNKVNLSDTKDIVEIAKMPFELAELFAEDLQGEEISKASSTIAIIPEVRQALLAMQRDFPANSSKNGVVIEGRDIGTVVFPDADIKFYITANLDCRAERRYKELLNKGVLVIYETIIEELQKRDERDSNRKLAPLKEASGAIVVDTTNLNAEEVLNYVLSFIPIRAKE
jgi:cytidylate kinase